MVNGQYTIIDKLPKDNKQAKFFKAKYENANIPFMNNKIIIYDDQCPLCAAYTNAFIKTGFIDKSGRKKFSTIQPDLISMVDIKRSVNEIPVIDTNTKQVWYGIDALLEILGQKIPVIKTIGNIKPIKWLLYKLYKFISYNRRVIVANQQPANSFDCTPEFNIRYRIYFIVSLLVFNAWMLFPVQKYLLVDSFVKTVSIPQLLYVQAALLLMHIAIALKLGKKFGMEYLGQVNMLAFITILITIPLITINKWLQLHNTTINNIYIGIAMAILIVEFKRRMEFVNIIPLYPVIVFMQIAGLATAVLYLID
jgi:predicted DCC family thiol-disulfide oxidoreductase YuxK